MERSTKKERIELSAGTIEYEDTGGSGPVIVFLHGVVMNSSVWRKVVQELRSDYRCIMPTMPLGGHRLPMRPDADLSPHGIARLEVEFLEKLDLRDVTLVGNDSGAFLIVAGEFPERLGRLVITPCEAFENFPPGLPGTVLGLASKIPGGLNALAQPMRFRPLRRLPVALGWMSKHPVPNAITDSWLRPALTNSKIRRDLIKYNVASVPGIMLAAAERLRNFDRPTLIVWTPEDRVMRRDHGQRFAKLLPNAQLVEISDSYTLIPEDQPVKLAEHIRAFVPVPVSTAA